jgi:hypothetical protein
MANQRGMPTALIRPTLPEPRNGELADESIEGEELHSGELADESADGEEQGRGVRPSRSKPNRTPKKKPEAGRGRKLILPDSLFDRLQLYAIKKRKTVSAVAVEVLDRNLPKLRIADE